MSEAKPYEIPKQLVWEAYQRVKANRGAAGVDGVSSGGVREGSEGQPLQDLEPDGVGIVLSAARAARRDTEGNGGTRPLGIPTVADRVAQTVVTMVLEPRGGTTLPPRLLWLPPRPVRAGRGGTARKRCWSARLGHRSGHQSVL